MRVLAGVRDAHQVTVACPSGGPLADAVDRAGRGAPAPARRGRKPPPAPGADPRRARPAHRRRPCAGAGLAADAPGRDPRQHPAHRAHGRDRPAAGRRAVRRARSRASARHSRRAGGARACSAAAREAIVANSDYTAARLNEGLARPAAVRVYNSIDHSRFDPAAVAGIRPARRAGARAGSPAPRAGGADHPLEGPGHLDQDARRAARRRASTRHLALVGQIAFGGKRRALRQPRLPASRSSGWPVSSSWAGQCTSSASARTCPTSWPHWTCPSCPPGRSRSAWPWWRAWRWAHRRS